MQNEQREVASNEGLRANLKECARKLKARNRRREDETKDILPIVSFHSGVGWEVDDITGTFW